MGWLQGLRYRNSSLLNQVPNELFGKPEFLQVETLPDQRTRKHATVAAEDGAGIIKPDATEAPSSEIERLLEATFGRKSLVKGQGEAEVVIRQSADTSSDGSPEIRRTFQDIDVKDDKLPLISMSEVISKKLAVGQNGLIDETSFDCLWIVVDNVVYDCSEFIEDHPGGKQVILSFVGEDCSWQFWRFHSRCEMEQYGRPLRIGRTVGVLNRFEQQPKYVGLRRNRQDEW